MFRNTATQRSNRLSRMRRAAFVVLLGLGVGASQDALAVSVVSDLSYQDTTIKKRQRDTNFVGSPELEISGGPGQLRSASLFLPDLAPLAGKFVLRATLIITKVETFSQACCDPTDYPVSVHAIGSSWIPEEVTWGSRPEWGSAASQVLVSSAAPHGTQYEFDITAIVRAWIDGDLPNYGLALAVDRFFATPGNIYAASQGAPLQRPRIEILATPEPGTFLLVGLGLCILIRMRERVSLIEPFTRAHSAAQDPILAA